MLDHTRSLWPNWDGERPYAVLVVGVLFMLFFSLLTRAVSDITALPFIGRAPETPDTVAVVGEGKATGVPNIAAVDLGVFTTAANVAAAQSETTKKMNDLTARLKALGLEERDLKTTQYNINPRYDYVNGRSVLRGYDVQQTLHVKVRQLDALGDVLKAAGEVGSNQIGGLTLTVEEPEALKAEARRKAIANAREKAGVLAREIGVTLGRVVSFSEESLPPGQPPELLYGRGGLGGGGGTPVLEQGSVEVTSTVTLSYELR
jgi:hypothetical protein